MVRSVTISWIGYKRSDYYWANSVGLYLALLRDWVDLMRKYGYRIVHTMQCLMLQTHAVV